MNWRTTVPCEAGAIGWASRIHRYVAPRDWPKALAGVPDEHRSEAEQYLRDMAQRMRTLRASKVKLAA